MTTTSNTVTNLSQIAEPRWEGQIVTWLLVAVGWVIVHYLTVTRERQKEIRELKSKVIERILDIEQRAIAFHQASSHSADEARGLLAEIERISSAISRQPLSVLSVDPKARRQFRRSVTLRNFDLSNFHPQAANSKLLSDISLAAECLTNSLEQAYAGRYLSQWWQVFRV